MVTFTHNNNSNKPAKGNDSLSCRCVAVQHGAKADMVLKDNRYKAPTTKHGEGAGGVWRTKLVAELKRIAQPDGIFGGRLAPKSTLL